MTQAPRRKSSLSGANPVAPVQQAAEPIAETPAPIETSPASAPVSKAKHKLSIYQDPEDTARLRAAYRRTFSVSSDRSFSDFVNRILLAEVERLEAQYNGGQPFQGVRAGELPTGRPVGE